MKSAGSNETAEGAEINQGWKSTGSFTCNTPSPSPEWPSTKRDPIKGISPHGKNKRRDPASLITTLDVCGLCYQGFSQSSLTLILTDSCPESLMLHLLLGTGVSLQWDWPRVTVPCTLVLGYHTALPSMGLNCHRSAPQPWALSQDFDSW